MSLEQQRKQLELERIKLAKRELEFKKLEKLEEISRLDQHIIIQDQKIQELEKEMRSK